MATHTASAVTTSLIRILMAPSCQPIGQVRSLGNIGLKRTLRASRGQAVRSRSRSRLARVHEISAGLADRTMAASSRGNRGIHGIGPQGRGPLRCSPAAMGSGDFTMFGWLMPDGSHQALFEGWDRQHYRPRHGRPPLVVRGAYSAASVIGRARERYLGAGEEESLAGAPGRRPQRADLDSLNTRRRSRRPAGRRSVQYVRPERGHGLPRCDRPRQASGVATSPARWPRCLRATLPPTRYRPRPPATRRPQYA